MQNKALKNESETQMCFRCWSDSLFLLTVLDILIINWLLKNTWLMKRRCFVSCSSVWMCSGSEVSRGNTRLCGSADHSWLCLWSVWGPVHYPDSQRRVGPLYEAKVLKRTLTSSLQERNTAEQKSVDETQRQEVRGWRWTQDNNISTRAAALIVMSWIIS